MGSESNELKFKNSNLDSIELIIQNLNISKPRQFETNSKTTLTPCSSALGGGGSEDKGLKGQ